jgi:hypothetical protein
LREEEEEEEKRLQMGIGTLLMLRLPNTLAVAEFI